MSLERINIFDLNFVSAKIETVVDVLINEACVKERKNKVVVTTNVDHIVKLKKDVSLYRLYSSADYILPDGFPIVACSIIAGKRLKQRITGADLFPALCKKLARRSGHVFILGGYPGDEDIIIAKMKKIFSGLTVSVMCPSMNFELHGTEAEHAIKNISNANPDIVFVCLSFKKQEPFILVNNKKIKAGMMIGVGAALDFTLGKIKRAPKIVQYIGMEWAWRLFSDPIRLWRRYLIEDMLFLKIALKEIMKNKIT